MPLRYAITSLLAVLTAFAIQASASAVTPAWETEVRKKVDRVKLIVLPVTPLGISDLGLAGFKKFAQQAAAETANFWTKNTNGTITVTSETRSAIAMDFPPTCNTTDQLRKILSRFGVTSTKPSTYYMALIDSKFLFCGRGLGGEASYGGQTGWVQFTGSISGDGSKLAHELGHNFGLLHVASEECKSGSKTVPLSRKCSVTNEYGDWYSIMGGGEDLSALERDLLGENIRNVRVTSPRTAPYVIADARSKARNRQLIFKPPLGWITLEYDSRAGVSMRRLDRPRGLQMVLNFGSETLNYRSVGSDRTQFLRPGDSYQIPGTKLRITIGAENSTARVYVTNALRPTPPLSAPTSVTVDKVIDEDTYELGIGVSWQGVAGKVTGYRVLVDGQTRCIANPETRRVVIAHSELPSEFNEPENDFNQAASRVSVVAVNTSGKVSPKSGPSTTTPDLSYQPLSIGWDPVTDGACRIP